MNFSGYININRRLIIDQDDEMCFEKWLNGHAMKRLNLNLEKWTKIRSLKENKYYWKNIVELLGDYFGYTKDEMHDTLRLKFLCVKTPGKPDKILSTRTLTTIQTETYYEEIRRWALMEYQIRIPLPNEQIE